MFYTLPFYRRVTSESLAIVIHLWDLAMSFTLELVDAKIVVLDISTRNAIFYFLTIGFLTAGRWIYELLVQ